MTKKRESLTIIEILKGRWDFLIVALTIVCITVVGIIYNDLQQYLISFISVPLTYFGYLLLEVKKTFEINQINLKKGKLGPVEQNFNDIGPLIINSKIIVFMGIHTNNFLNEYSDKIQSFLENGGRMFWLVMSPESQAMHMVISRYMTSTSDSTNSEKQNIIANIEKLQLWQKQFSNKNIKIKKQDYLFERAFLFFCPKVNDITVDVETKEIEIERGNVIEQRYTYKYWGVGRKPKFTYDEKEDWFELAKTEFKEHWKDAIDV